MIANTDGVIYLFLYYIRTVAFYIELWPIRYEHNGGVPMKLPQSNCQGMNLIFHEYYDVIISCVPLRTL